MKNISTISILFTAYALMVLTTAMLKKSKPGSASYNSPQLGNLEMLNYFHSIGVLIVLLASCSTQPLPFFLLTFPDRISLPQTIAFLTAFSVIGFFPWKRFANEADVAQNIFEVPVLSVAYYSFLRTAFLAVYEWFFRGLLLISFSTWVGITWGIVINILMYALLHFHKDKKEMIGCIPLGLLLCVFTIWWQSIWPAIIFHLELAIINEWPPLQKFILPQKQTAL